MGEFIDDIGREHEEPPPKERRKRLQERLERDYLEDYHVIRVLQYVRTGGDTYRVLFWRRKNGKPGWTQRVFCTATWNDDREEWSVEDVEVAGRRHWA